MNIEDMVSKYEYKAPSYELIDRPEKELPALEQPRFVKNGACWRSVAEDKDEITMMFTGDLMCQEGIFAIWGDEGGNHDFDGCYEPIRALFKTADFVAGNLETPISQSSPYRGEIITCDGSFFCNTPIEYLRSLNNAGFDMLTTANNHILDAGLRGLLETLDNVEEYGFINTGCNRPGEPKCVVVDVCGYKVGFYAVAVSFNDMDLNLTEEGREELIGKYVTEHAKQALKSMKDEGAEFTICFPHWGKEYTDVISKRQTAMANLLTDMGFDLILGSHSHVLQQYTIVNNTPVLYSMGNLMSHLNASGATESIETAVSVVCVLKLKRGEEGIESNLTFIPCRITSRYSKLPYCVVPMTDSLHLEETLGMTFDRVFSTTRERMMCPEELIIRDYPVDQAIAEESKAKLEKLVVEKKDRIAHFLAVKKNAPSAKDELAARLEELKSGLSEEEANRYRLAANGVYRLTENGEGAILVSFASRAGSVLIPKDVDASPVIGIENENIFESHARALYVNAGCKYVGKGSFKGHTTLESVVLPLSVERIEESAFEGCTTMTGIICRSRVSSIGPRAFAGCSNLMSIKIKSSETAIAPDAFEGCPKLTIYCEEGSVAQGYAQEHGIPFVAMPMSLSEKETAAHKKVLSAAKRVKVAPSGPATGKKQPDTIIAACKALGAPLPSNASVDHQPSAYLGEERFTGKLFEVKKILGSNLPEISDEDLRACFKKFKWKYKTQKCLNQTKTDLAVYFTDWMLFCRDRGFTHNCYFDYELYNKEWEHRDTFLNEGYRSRVFKACNNSPKRMILTNKAAFNAQFPNNVKRDWIDANTCTFEEFAAFASRHEKAFGKPVEGTGGAGAHIVDLREGTLEELFETAKAETLILEEIIKQHPKLAEVNASTLNTVRINTLLCADGTPRVTLTVARFGRAGNVVDNFHGGGVGAIVDIETGVIHTEAINQAHQRSPKHPDSDIQLLGFQYPEWEKVKKAVCDSAMLMPDVRHIGWDVSVTENGDIEFVEANARPNFDVLQSPDQVGRRFRYEEYLREIEAMNGIESKELEPLVINVTAYSKPTPKPKKKPSMKKRIKRKIKRVLKKVGLR